MVSGKTAAPGSRVHEEGGGGRFNAGREGRDWAASHGEGAESTKAKAAQRASKIIVRGLDAVFFIEIKPRIRKGRLIALQIRHQ